MILVMYVCFIDLWALECESSRMGWKNAKKRGSCWLYLDGFTNKNFSYFSQIIATFSWIVDSWLKDSTVFINILWPWVLFYSSALLCFCWIPHRIFEETSTCLIYFPTTNPQPIFTMVIFAYQECSSISYFFFFFLQWLVN